MIERALRDAGKTPDVKIHPKSLSHALPRRDAIVYKMHGDVSHAHDAVISKDDYEAYEQDRRLFTINLQGDLVSKSFLFVGFSFTDPNLGSILGRIRGLLGQEVREHYALFRRVLRADYNDPEKDADENERDYVYDRVREEHRVLDLQRYGVQTVFLDDYAEIPSVLKRVLDQYRRRNVFVSGAAATYGGWSRVEALERVHVLSFEIVKAENRLLWIRAGGGERRRQRRPQLHPRESVPSTSMST